MKSLGIIVGKPKAPHVYMGDDRFVLPNHCFGLEFEFEKVRDSTLPVTDWSQFWHSVQDGSLHDSGREYTFSGPLFGRDAITAIDGIVNHAKENRWSTSARTGLHVHIDCRDLMPQQLVGMLVLYALYEPAIYRFVGDQREENAFCRPWFRCSGAVDIAARVTDSIAREGGFEENWPALVNNKELRYAGLNLQSMADLCTVEWRQLKMTLDRERIINWVNIALSFKKAAYAIPVSNVSILDDVLRHGATAYAQEYMPTALDCLAYEGLDAEVEEIGYPVAFDLLKGPPDAPWNRPMPVGPNALAKAYILKRCNEQSGASLPKIAPRVARRGMFDQAAYLRAAEREMNAPVPAPRIRQAAGVYEALNWREAGQVRPAVNNMIGDGGDNF